MARVSKEAAGAEPQNSMAGPTGEKPVGLKGFLASFEPLPDLPWSRNWGLLQIALGLFSVFFSSAIGLSIGSFLAGPGSFEEYQSGDGSPGLIGVSALFGFQIAMFFWPFVVSKVWRGRGVVKDWGLEFTLSDLTTGFAAAVAALVIVPLVAAGSSRLVGLEDQSEANNTQFLTDAEGSPWLFALIFGVVIGAPVVEEVFFRGLVLRSLERFGGRVIGVIGSSVLFGLLHFQDASLEANIVLLLSIGSVGVLFGALAAVTHRLGASIVGHVLFNSTVVVFTFLA